MERQELNEKDDSQKAKIIFFSLGSLVLVVMIWSLTTASTARSERNVVKQQMELLQSEIINLEQIRKDLGRENESLRNRISQLEAQLKAKPQPKPAQVNKKSTTSTKKKTTRTR